MKRIVALCLLLLLVVGMYLPASAAANVSEFDKTTSADKMDLVVTEVLINSKTGQNSLDNVQEAGSVSKFSSPDAFDYIEIYNRGTTAINLYQLKILSANSKDFTGTSNQFSADQNAQNKYLFKFQNVLVPGSIHDDNAAAGAASGSLGEYNTCKNPTTAVLAPGQVAVIWFWTSATDSLCNKLGQTEYPVGDMWEGDSRYFPYFRNYYGIADDVLVVATNAKASAHATGDVYNDLRNGYTYAFAKTAFNFGNKCYTQINGLDSNILTMFEYSTNTDVGIPTTDNMDDVSAYYVPSNCTPDLYNANQSKIVGEGWVDKTDYVQISDSTVSMGMKYVRSYRECAVVTYTEEPTPGSMPAWQWFYVQPGTVGTGANAYSLKATEEAVFTAAADKAAFDAAMSKIITDWMSNTAIKDANGRLLADTGDTNWPLAAKAQFLIDYAAEITEEEDDEEIKKDDPAGVPEGTPPSTDQEHPEGTPPSTDQEHPEGTPPQTNQEQTTPSTEESNNASAPAEEQTGLPGYAIALIVIGAVILAVLIGLGVFMVLYSKKWDGRESEMPANAMNSAPVGASRAGLTESLRQSWETCKKYPLAPNVAHCTELVKALLRLANDEKTKELLTSIDGVLKMMKPAVLQNAELFGSLAGSINAMLESLEKM